MFTLTAALAILSLLTALISSAFKYDAMVAYSMTVCCLSLGLHLLVDDRSAFNVRKPQNKS